MSTFLELCQALRQEAGISGAGPVTTAGQSGILLDVVSWVRRAYNMVQLEETRWKFLWREQTFSTILGQKTYHPVSDLGFADFKEWDVQSFFVRRNSVQQKQPLFFVEREVLRDYDAVQITSLPQYFTVLPDKSIRLDATPTIAEVVEVEYYAKPFNFVNDSDTPAFPEDFHDVVLYKALMLYAANDEAGNIYQDAAANYRIKIAELRVTQLDRPYVSMSPLA